MRFGEIIRTAMGNAFRSRLRTTLTVLAIFVGAFTLTLTNGVGTGITNYIDSQVSSFGASDVMMITQSSLAEGGAFGDSGSGPTEYDPDRTVMSGQIGGPQIEALGPADLEIIRGIDSIVSVEPMQMASPDYIQWNDGTRFEFTINPMPAGSSLNLVAGTIFADDGDAAELLLPVSYVEPMGFSSYEAAVGQTVTIGVSDFMGTQHQVDATVSGVQEDTLLAFGLITSRGLISSVAAAQTSGLPPAMAELYPLVTAQFAGNADPEVIKSDLAAAGYTGQTIADQMGAINTVINAIVAVLNSFAVIALIAAGFGIMKVSNNGRIREFVEKPQKDDQLKELVFPREAFEKIGFSPARGRDYLGSMGVYAFKANLLMDMLTSNKEWNDFGQHVIPSSLKSHKVVAHPFMGYWEDIGTVRSYFDSSIALTGSKAPFELNDPTHTIYTNSRYLPGAQINGASITDSILCEGCRIEEATLKNAIVGIRTHIRKGVEIERSIIMGADYYEEHPRAKYPLGIGRDCKISGAIIDKNARIGKGVVIRGSKRLRDQTGEGWAIRDGVAIVLKNAVIPDGTVIG